MGFTAVKNIILKKLLGPGPAVSLIGDGLGNEKLL
jgi:hypothetical protein